MSGISDQVALFGATKLYARGPEHGKLKHGIGVHTGEVLAANIGSPDRLSYAMVGDTVNVASRIQEMNKFFETDILISETTKAGLNSEVITDKLPPAMAKGIKEPLQLFEIYLNK